MTPDYATWTPDQIHLRNAIIGVFNANFRLQTDSDRGWRVIRLTGQEEAADALVALFEDRCRGQEAE